MHVSQPAAQSARTVSAGRPRKALSTSKPLRLLKLIDDTHQKSRLRRSIRSTACPPTPP
jgi:hypothetical protein